MLNIRKALTGVNSVRFEPGHWQIVWQTLAVLALLCLELLLYGNMGRTGWNEIDVLPLARQFTQPNWISQDWYLNQPAGYRLLFQTMFGWLAATWGFLATSIAGRLLCYTFFAFGLVQLGRKLGIGLVLLLLALMLYLHSGCDRFLLDRCAYKQGAIAGEWLIGGLEAKALAYSLLPWSIALMLAGQYRLLAFVLGVMTSFHVLVGGWMFLVVLGWIMLNRRVYPKSLPYWGGSLLIYLAASGFAIPAVFQQLTTSSVTDSLSPSYIYVFLRLPHHLNSLTWPPERWIRPIALVVVLLGSVVVLQNRLSNQRRSAELNATESDTRERAIVSRPTTQELLIQEPVTKEPATQEPVTREQTINAMRLAQLVAIALIPFGLGLLIAPFDSQGRWLQYYPFRIGDVLLPLGACLLLACALERSIAGKAHRIFRLVCLLLLGMSLYLQVPSFYQQILALREFPNEIQDVDPAWQNFTGWIREETPKAAIVISPPVELTNFTWLTERPTIAKFKFLPQNPTGIVAWHERMSDLGGGASVWNEPTQTEVVRMEIEDRLTAGYNQLTTAQVQALMQKYQADYFATQQDHQLDLPIAYRNDRYILYASNNASVL